MTQSEDKTDTPFAEYCYEMARKTARPDDYSNSTRHSYAGGGEEGWWGTWSAYEVFFTYTLAIWQPD